MQAQRKFAQVCGGSVTSTLPSNLISNHSTQNDSTTKSDNIAHDLPQELLPNRRPNTEDFLTFLCFRGTTVLPSHLDFFNTNKNVDQIQNKTKSNANLACCSSKQVKQEEKQQQQQQQPEINSEKNENIDEIKTEIDSLQTFIPFAVRKRADTVAVGSRKQTVQALKKKYQDQRIAKNNREQCKTRSSTVNEGETSNKQQQKMLKSKQNENVTTVNTDAVVTDTTSTTVVRNIKRKLRGNAASVLPAEKIEKEPIASKSQKTVKESNARSQKNAESNNKSTKINTRNTKSIGSIPTKLDEKDKDKEKDVDESNQTTRTTRQRSYSLPKGGKSFVLS